MAHGGYGWGAPFQVWRGGNSFHPVLISCVGTQADNRFPGEAGAAGGVARAERAEKSPPSSAQSPLLATSLCQQQKFSSSTAQSNLCPCTGSRKNLPFFPPAFQRNKGHFAAWQALLPHCPPRAEPRAAVPGWLPKQGAAELRQPGVCIFHVPDGLIAPKSFSYGPTSWP